MKRVIDILKYLCSIGAAIVIYITVLKATEGKEDMLMYIVTSVLSASLAISLFALSSLSARLSSLERRFVFLSDDGYEEDDAPKRECAYCHAYIDASEEICPYCANEGAPSESGGEYFATEDPDYKGTDFSGEEYVSANTDGTEQ